MGAGDTCGFAALAFIHQVFEVERDATNKELSFEQRRARRQEASAEILYAFKLWLGELEPQASPKSPSPRRLAVPAGSGGPRALSLRRRARTLQLRVGACAPWSHSRPQGLTPRFCGLPMIGGEGSPRFSTDTERRTHRSSTGR